ncbi:MAG: DUF4065 domain-containing protein [Alphaproteobacteria bacterium]
MKAEMPAFRAGEAKMATVYDVAAYILSSHGEMTAMKLQKLVYYCQAWHIAWTDDILFNERIEAWADGPVSPDLFQLHRGTFRLSKLPEGDAARLTDDERDTIDRVLAFYGDKSPQWLSDLTHNEEPWRIARGNLPDRAVSQVIISPEVMGSYYSSLH